MKKSILIITYGREKEFLDILNEILKYNKKDIELLILDNNFNNKLEEEIKKMSEKINFEVKYFNDGINYGVAKGRNYLINQAKGEILVTLDDDVEIKCINTLLEKIEVYFQSDLEIGCLAFNIKNYYLKKSLTHEIPHGNKRLDFSKNLETYYFIGAGHAIRKKVYNEIGVYPENFGLYGTEELDLSYRIIKKYKILYVADIVIYHKASPNGRKDNRFNLYRNKMLVNKKYLPAKYVVSSFFIWSFYYIFFKKGKIKDVKKVLKDMKNIKGEKLSLQEIKKLKKIDARLLY